MSKVSVIIPNYNCASCLHKAISSCLIQKYLHEIIVVDDHSTDNSWETLLELQNLHPTILKIYKNKEKGGNYARNMGFEKSSGDYIQWLDADDYLLEHKFENQISLFQQYTNTDIVYSDWYMDFYDEQKIITSREQQQKSDYKDFTLEILADNWSVPANYLLSRTMAAKLHKHEAWNVKRQIAQDREYFTIAALLGAKFRYCKGYFCVYNRWSNNQVSAMNFNKRLEHQIELELKFREIIIKNKYPKNIEKKYLSILNAHTLNACYYNPKLTIAINFSFFNIFWQKIHWKKRPFIPFIYIWQHLKYFYSLFFNKNYH